jgi:propionate catabolism operon transcriptional regulator
MRQQIGIISVGRMSNALAKAISEMDLPVDFIFHEILMYEGMVLPPTLRHVDVFLSSGYNAQVLKSITDKPVITIEPSIYDILLAFSQAIKFDFNPVIIFPLENHSSRIDKIRDILAVDIRVDSYNNFQSHDGIISRHKKNGCKCIIGSGLVCEMAEKYGLKSIFVYPEESLRSYIQLAYDMAASIFSQNEKNQQMSNVIFFSHSGIVFTDQDGKIFICNPAAQRIFQHSAESVIGRKITDFFHDPNVTAVYKTCAVNNNILCTIGTDQFVLSAIPIMSKGKLGNMLFILTA